MGNAIESLVEALGKAQSTESFQEIQDAKSTEFMASQEANIYNYWNVFTYNGVTGGELGYDAAQVKYWADKGKTDKENEWQTQYNKDATEASANSNQADGAVQSAQSQTSADGTNLQTMAGYAQSVMQVMNTLTNLLGRLLA